MISPLALRKWVLLTHRWMGVGGCVLFAMWFVSGIVMMYSDYPRVQAADRLRRALPLDAAAVRKGPAEAFAALGETSQPDLVRLTMLDGRPVYRFHYGRLQSLVYADTGLPAPRLEEAAGRRIAAQWTGLPERLATFEGFQMKEDQWTLNQAVRPLRPFLKYSWPDGQEVYVSQVTGEVMQHTTRATRLAAWLGAIPHWLYFTVIRKQTEVWRVVVIALSALGSVMALLGLAGGWWLYSPSRRYRDRAGAISLPYAGAKRWHTGLGLLFGLFTFTWILSGMFSMNPLHWAPAAGPHPEVSFRLRGDGWDLRAFALEPPDRALRRAGERIAVKELEFCWADGKPAYLAIELPGKSVFFPPGGVMQPESPVDTLVGRLGPGVRRVRLDAYDHYYIDRHGRKPLPVEKLDLPDGSTHYLDPKTGKVVQSYVTLSRWNRWLYHGLHSFDLPLLYRRRPLWDVVVLGLMLGGTLLSFTGVWIAGQRLRRKGWEFGRSWRLRGLARSAKALPAKRERGAAKACAGTHAGS